MANRICIVGLGLMGGSLAYALQGFDGAEIVGMDTDPDVRQQAETKGAVVRAYGNIGKAVEGARVVVFCVYPHHIPSLLQEASPFLQEGVVLSDICGVKTGLYRRLETLIPPHADYVGVHPMAGKERDGFENADAGVYRNSGFLITPLHRTKPESIQLMRRMAVHIGVGRIAISPIEQHDEIIAYTSDLMHIASAALCMTFHPEMNLAFAAGAFRDCTRIADINASAWTELLMENSDNVLPCLTQYIGNLEAIRRAISDRDDKALSTCLEQAGNNKREMQAR